MEKTGEFDHLKKDSPATDKGIEKELKRTKPNESDEQPDLSNDQHIRIYERIVENLKSKNTPDTVHFREKEELKICNFLANYLVGDSFGLSTLIVTGKPGGGKTLLISNILNRLYQKQYDFFDFYQGEISGETRRKKIEILELNAMKYSNCFPFVLDLMASIYEKAGEEFNKDKYKNSVYLLESFKVKLNKILKKYQFIILVDELDTLATYDRKDFDNIVEFLNISDKGFVKIGISNTLDLFATYKGTKNYLNSKKLTFQPYQSDDLVGILKERISASLREYGIRIEGFVDEKVLTIICKKIYKNASGDIRAMLSVAKEIFENKLKQIRETKVASKISLKEAMTVLSSKYEDRTIDVIKSFSLSIQVALFALYFCISPSKEIFPLVVFFSDHKSIYRTKLDEAKQLLSVNLSENINDVLSTLETYNFLKLDKASNRGSKQTITSIRSNYKKFELQEYLVEIPIFRQFILQGIQNN